MALGVNGGYGKSSIRIAMVDLKKICSQARRGQPRADEIEMPVFVEISQMAICSDEQVVVCFDERSISDTEHHHWIIYKDDVRMSVSVNVSYCCTFYPAWVRESKLGRNNVLELT